MAARPNTTRTLQYGLSLADVQCDRLERAIAMANFALANNKLLTNEEIAAYKTAITLARKQQAVFEKVSSINIPSNLIPPTKRRPGRPSAKELEAIKTAKLGKATKAAKSDKTDKAVKAAKTSVKAGKSATATTTGKRRGRPAKNASTANNDTTTVKRRGRPPKAAATAPATDATVSNTLDTKS